MYSEQFWNRIIGFVKRQDVSYKDLLEKQNLHIAAASLFIHAALVDSKFHKKEFDKIHIMVRDRFGYDEVLIDHLIIHANRTNNEQMDVDSFIEVLNRNLNDKQRDDFMAMIWKIIIADGKIHKFEQRLADTLAPKLGIGVFEREKIKTEVLMSEAKHRSDIRKFLDEQYSLDQE